MKHLVTLLLAGATALTTANAQAFVGNKFLDNWSIGINGGAVTPSTRDYWKHVRAVSGLELTKGLTPYVSLGISSTVGWNTTGQYTAVDNVNTLLLGKFNLSNIFCGWPGNSTHEGGRPRVFEVEAVAGIGLNHYFGKYDKDNVVSSKFGLDFDFNLGKERAWTVSISPAIAYDLETPTETQYDLRSSVLELTAGVTYHFKSSNGHHHFTTVKPYDQAEVDGLNAKINDLRGQLDNKNNELSKTADALRRTQQELNDCRNKKPAVEQVVNTNQTMESVVTFRQGKSTVDAAQLPNVERIATYMKNHSDAKVSIKGYASPEGSADLNAKLATKRAEAVKSILVNKYKIASSRISAEGQGVGNMFSEPDWNRVSICTLEESK